MCNFSNQISNQILKDAREAETKVVQSDATAELKSKVVEVTDAAIQQFNSLYDISHYITDKMDKISNPHWQCFVYRENYGTFSIALRPKHFIALDKGQLRIIVFQAAIQSR